MKSPHRIFELFLLLFPRAFRDRFGASMRETFEDRLEESRKEGTRAVAGFGLRTAGDMSVTVRNTPGAPPPLPVIREEVRAMDASLPLYQVETVEQALQRHVAPTRFYMILVGLFAGLAAVLAAVGLYGVVAYSVSRRTREIGLRVVLGARRDGIVRLVVGPGHASRPHRPRGRAGRRALRRPGDGSGALWRTAPRPSDPGWDCALVGGRYARRSGPPRVQGGEGGSDQGAAGRVTPESQRSSMSRGTLPEGECQRTPAQPSTDSNSFAES